MTSSSAEPRFAKVTISLPAQLLGAVDRLQRKTGHSRSEIFRRAVEELFASERERADEQRWLNAYRDQPQRNDELGWTESALGSLAENPWDSPAGSGQTRRATRRGPSTRST
jgi:Arc/MetJ-type ribon-helix-helix transcriptional regulator